MDIRQLIGETTDYDKKLALEEKKPKSWCKSISAFANCFGGKLIFGVSNDNELVGLADAEGDAEKISEAIKTHLNPIPEFKLYFEKDGEKIFVIVEVMKGQQTPYYYEGDGQLIAFMRIGNETTFHFTAFHFLLLIVFSSLTYIFCHVHIYLIFDYSLCACNLGG